MICCPNSKCKFNGTKKTHLLFLIQDEKKKIKKKRKKLNTQSNQFILTTTKNKIASPLAQLGTHSNIIFFLCTIIFYFTDFWKKGKYCDLL